MLSNEVKENMIVGIILASGAQPETKEELIEYVRSRNDHCMQACFRLGQMDFRESAVKMLQDNFQNTPTFHRRTAEAAAIMIQEMEVI